MDTGCADIRVRRLRFTGPRGTGRADGHFCTDVDPSGADVGDRYTDECA